MGKRLTPSEVIQIRRAVLIREQIRAELAQYTNHGLAQAIGVDVKTINNVIAEVNHRHIALVSSPKVIISITEEEISNVEHYLPNV